MATFNELEKIVQDQKQIIDNLLQNLRIQESRIDELQSLTEFIDHSDRAIFDKDIEMADGRNVESSAVTGTKIGTNTNQKFGFWNVTPVDQPDTVSDPSGGGTVDSESRTAINAIIDRLQELGLIA